MKDTCFIIRAIPREKSALVCLCSKLSHVWKSQKVENVTSVGKKKSIKDWTFQVSLQNYVEKYRYPEWIFQFLITGSC